MKVGDLSPKKIAEFTLPVLTAGIENQGLNNYAPRDNATILKNVISISANGANTGATFYQNKEFTVLQDAYAISFKEEYIPNDNQYLFLTGAIAKSIYGNFAWTDKAGWEKVKKEFIQLPTKDGKIDFEFMDACIRELEEERIRELEEERIRELSAYLTVSGLDNYELSSEEKEALENLKLLEWEEKDVTDQYGIFNVKNTKNILSNGIKPNSGNTPYLCASADNNSVSSYIKYKEELKDKGNCIFIGGKTFVVSYQGADFFSNDSHNLALYLKDEDKADTISQLFIATCIRKSLSYKYSWGNSISNKKIQNDKIMLPTKDGKIDFEFMELLISAVQKLVIKDVVLYADEKIQSTKKIVKEN